MIDFIGADQLDRELADLCRRKPDRVNPDCVYTDDDGRHCLIGEYAMEKGWDLPEVGSPGNERSAWVLAAELGWPTDRTRLQIWQVVADADNCPPWRDVPGEVPDP